MRVSTKNQHNKENNEKHEKDHVKSEKNAIV
jgi:hypothetical protein